GDTVRYVETIQATQNGISVVTREIDTGVIFNIAGRVSGSGAIALDLDQRFTILTGFTPVPGGGQIPQTSDRQTKMFVNMRDGETVAIGGLIQEQDVRRVSGVPILKDLPILGWLFKRTENERQRTEVVFFLTAKKVERGELPSAASPRNSEMITPDPLQDYRETGSNP
ncbi:MAG: type II secretion system protein GspD, partial [Fimbriimonadaceae bacterium]